MFSISCNLVLNFRIILKLISRLKCKKKGNSVSQLTNLTQFKKYRNQIDLIRLI